MAVAAVAMLASCSNDETTGKAVNGNTIKFDGFVNKSVKGAANDLNNTTFNSFQVWGLMSKGEQTGTPFNGTTVTKSGSDWTYNGNVYWENGYNYSFVAIAPAGFGTFNAPDKVGEYGSIDFKNGEGTTDLIYDIDDYYVTNAVSTTTTCPGPINFTFNHLLSRVKFAFKNGMDDGSTINVTGVTITNANTKATATLGATATWELADDNDVAELSFGNVILDAEATGYAENETKETDHKYMIPATSADQKYTVTFVVTRHHSGVTDQYNHEVEIPAVTMKQGKSYKFTAELNAQNITGDPDDPDNPQLCPIQFSATVSDWDGFNETELVLPSAGSQEP